MQVVVHFSQTLKYYINFPKIGKKLPPIKHQDANETDLRMSVRIETRKCPSKRKHPETDETVALTSPDNIQEGGNEPSESGIILRMFMPGVLMPYRHRDPPQFTSCFVEPIDIGLDRLPQLETVRLQFDHSEPDSWLSASFIDLVFLTFASLYPDTHFMSTDFAVYQLPAAERNNLLDSNYVAKDILGNEIQYDSSKSIVFVANPENIHWNLLRLQHWPVRELQLFEPMGKPATRHRASLRSVPRAVMVWLDACFPLEPCEDVKTNPSSAQSDSSDSDTNGHGVGESEWRRRSRGKWAHLSVSAITKQHQITGFDCGVACLLYAEKCGQGVFREDVNEWTTQEEITKFRACLRQSLASSSCAINSAKGSINNSSSGSSSSSVVEVDDGGGGEKAESVPGSANQHKIPGENGGGSCGEMAEIINVDEEESEEEEKRQVDTCGLV